MVTEVEAFFKGSLMQTGPLLSSTRIYVIYPREDVTNILVTRSKILEGLGMRAILSQTPSIFLECASPPDVALLNRDEN